MEEVPGQAWPQLADFCAYYGLHGMAIELLKEMNKRGLQIEEGTATHARVYLSGIIDEILNVENGPVLREIIVKVQDSDTIDRLCSELQEGAEAIETEWSNLRLHLTAHSLAMDLKFEMHISPTGNGQDLDNIRDQQVADCEIRHWKEHVVGTANDMGYDNDFLRELSLSEDDRKKALAFSIETLIRDLQEIGGQGPAVNKHKVIALLTKFPFSDMVQKFSKFIKTLLRKANGGDLPLVDQYHQVHQGPPRAPNNQGPARNLAAFIPPNRSNAFGSSRGIGGGAGRSRPGQSAQSALAPPQPAADAAKGRMGTQDMGGHAGFDGNDEPYDGLDGYAGHGDNDMDGGDDNAMPLTQDPDQMDEEQPPAGGKKAGKKAGASGAGKKAASTGAGKKTAGRQAQRRTTRSAAAATEDEEEEEDTGAVPSPVDKLKQATANLRETTGTDVMDSVLADSGPEATSVLARPRTKGRQGTKRTGLGLLPGQTALQPNLYAQKSSAQQISFEGDSQEEEDITEFTQSGTPTDRNHRQSKQRRLGSGMAEDGQDGTAAPLGLTEYDKSAPAGLPSKGANSTAQAQDSSGGKNKKRKRFEKAEVSALQQAINCGMKGQWAKILRQFPIFKKNGRTAVDIKDKFRNLVKVGEITEPSSTAPKVPMTETAQDPEAEGEEEDMEE